MIDTVFILAGGKGTRLSHLTSDIPKPMIKVGVKPILQHVLDWYDTYHFKKAILSVAYKKEKIMDYFGGSYKGIEIIYAPDPEGSFLGTGGPLKKHESILPKEFLFANGDILTSFNLSHMIERHKANKAWITNALKAVHDPQRYGVAVLEGERITSFLEKPEKPPTNLINAGISLMSKKVVDFIPENKFCSIEREVYPKIVELKKQFGYEIIGPWIDIGIPEALKAADTIW
jgi:mannose-1-phosphate guanylyltransferase